MTSTSFNLGVAFNHSIVSQNFMIRLKYAKVGQDYVKDGNGGHIWKPNLIVASEVTNDNANSGGTSICSNAFETKEEAAAAMKRLNRRIQRYLNRQEIKESINRKNDVRGAA